MTLDVAIFAHSDFGAMAADGGQYERRENTIDVVQRPAADKGHRTVKLTAETLQRLSQIFGNKDFLRPRRDVEQRAVDVQHDGDIVE